MAPGEAGNSGRFLTSVPGAPAATTPYGGSAFGVLAPSTIPTEMVGGNGAPEPCGSWECPCGPPGRFWLGAEYLLWWIKDSHTPPLVTTSPVGSAGILGRPGTSVLYGGEISNDVRSGGRFTGGYWLNCQQTIGIEGSYLFLGARSVNFVTGTQAGGGTSTIARPFFNALTGTEDSQLVSQPGFLNGTVATSLSSRLQGAELNGICNLCCGCTGRVDLLGGFRYLQLDEGLGISENLTVAPGVPLNAGTNLLVNDQFTARNWFYGGQIGVRAEVWRGRFFANVTGKVALGDTHQGINVGGSTTITPPGRPSVTAPGGLLALPTNSGYFERDRFAVVPEVGINVGYQATKHLRVFVGYTFLYWSNVVRPGDQIDRTVNPTQLPVIGVNTALAGPARPAPVLHSTDFWAQGINFGVQVRY